MNEAAAILAQSFPLGLIPAVHTPLDASGDLNLQGVEKQAARIVSQNLGGVFVAGTTGECHSLTVEQRQRLTARWCDVARGTRLRVIVHVGHNCQRDACELAAHAGQCGAAAVSAMAPFYFKPETNESLIEFLAPIANRARETPFYFYDIPHFTGVNLNVARFLHEAKERIPTFAGVKFTNPDLMQMQQCVQLDNARFDVLHGFDETLLAGVALGARGAVGNTYNIAAPNYQALLNCWATGDWEGARKYQSIGVKIILLLQSFRFQEAAKAAMELVGIDCGPPLPPLVPLSKEAKKELFNGLTKFGIGR